MILFSNLIRCFRLNHTVTQYLVILGCLIFFYCLYSGEYHLLLSAVVHVTSTSASLSLNNRTNNNHESEALPVIDGNRTRPTDTDTTTTEMGPLLLSTKTIVRAFNSSTCCISTNGSINAATTVETTIASVQQQQSSTVNYLTHEPYQLMERYTQERDDPLNVGPSSTHFKRILLWHEAYYGSENFDIGYGRDAFRRLGCPVWQCETSNNRTDVHNYDAILFHYRSWKLNDLPQRRLPQQRYVFWTWESPMWRIYGDNPSLMGNFFNWTMTYRWDSDMVHPYGYVRPTGNVPLHPSEDQMRELLSVNQEKNNYATGKTKMAAWMVSNCGTRSGRNEMVGILQKYIQIDVYGDCGTLTCPKKMDKSFQSTEECLGMVAKNYKFYFALENSLCRDYVTEKFFENMRRPILPVVYGLHDDHEKMAPSHSFINAAKFQNMKSLADYLILLDGNDTMYNEYFWWKDHFEIRNSVMDKNRGMCHLCASLHNKTMPTKIYSNMTDWWEQQSFCRIPKIN